MGEVNTSLFTKSTGTDALPQGKGLDVEHSDINPAT